jgi:hypothetical protein
MQPLKKEFAKKHFTIVHSLDGEIVDNWVVVWDGKLCRSQNIDQCVLTDKIKEWEEKCNQGFAMCAKLIAYNASHEVRLISSSSNLGPFGSAFNSAQQRPSSA